MPIFDNFFSKWSQMKTNEDKDMKPTLKGHNYAKFSNRERSSLLSHSSLVHMYFKGRTEVEVGDLIFCREIFPYLESSLAVVNLSTFTARKIIHQAHKVPKGFKRSWRRVAFICPTQLLFKLKKGTFFLTPIQMRVTKLSNSRRAFLMA